MTRERMQDYCLRRSDFNPDGFFVAVDANEVAGYGGRGKDQSRGIIHLLAVGPRWRRKGVGGRLLEACESYLSESRKIIVGAMGLDIFFSHTRSSLLPAWGSSEGIGIHGEDLEMRTFLEKRTTRFWIPCSVWFLTFADVPCGKMLRSLGSES